MGLYDDGDELNKHMVWTGLSRSYFMVFNSKTRKGNNSFGMVPDISQRDFKIILGNR